MASGKGRAQSLATSEAPAVQEQVGAGWRNRVVGRSLAPAADKAVRRGQQLLSAAGKLILESGADDFTVQQVANKAGLSLRAFYQHFEGKDDLLIALAEETHIVLAELLAYHADKFENPLDRLGSAVYFSVDDRQHTPSSYNAASARFTSRASLAAPAELARSRKPLVDFWSAAIQAAVTSQKAEAINPEHAAFGFFALINNYSRSMYVGNDFTTELPGRAEYVRFCVSALGVRPPRGWEDKFELSDAEAKESRHHSEQVVARFMRTGA